MILDIHELEYFLEHSTHHGEEKAERHEQIVVSGERYSHPQHELTEAGEPHDLHPTNSAARETRDTSPFINICCLRIKYIHALKDYGVSSA